MELKIKKFDNLTVSELHNILKTRISIFVVEQECAYQEADDTDRRSFHLWFEEEGIIKAYLRIFKKEGEENTAQIGRVLSVERRKGLATKILSEGINAAKELMNADGIYLEAQTYALSLYTKAGFSPCGEEFSEDGIPHTPMYLKLK